MKLQLQFFNYLYRDYEDIRCEEADQVILERVKAGEEINLPNGKLLERLLTIKLYRESKYSPRQGPEVIKHFLFSTEHEIYPAHKC